jgi:thiol-disulfide isomerase/thioredoxin
MGRKEIKILGLILISFLMTSGTHAQDTLTTFILKGEINTDTGRVVLMPVWDTSYYPTTLRATETKIVAGRFTLTDSIAYPYGFRLGVKQKDQWIYLSDYFIVDPGLQTIICNIDSTREIPDLENTSMKEFRKDLLPGLQLAELKSKSRERKIAEQRIVLAQYIGAHPASFIGLWYLIRQMEAWGYDSAAEVTISQFAEPLKNTFTAKVLKTHVIAAASSSPGHLFPRITILNGELNEVEFPAPNKFKYTLVDFWFNHCYPCIGQFPVMQKMFSLFHDRGFNISAISIDGKREISNWKAVISKFQLPWDQYLDLSGKEAEKLIITGYPTNFLLDKNGIIIARDIELNSLAAFLKDNL